MQLTEIDNWSPREDFILKSSADRVKLKIYAHPSLRILFLFFDTEKVSSCI